MSLIRYDPFRELRTLTRGFNSLNELFDAQQFPELNLSAFVPHINTREGKFAYHIDVDLPGVNKDNVDIHIEEGVLHIFGERKTKEETKKEDYYKIESSFGHLTTMLKKRNRFLSSNGEVRRALKENSISVNKTKVSEGYSITSQDLIANKYVLLQRGKKKYFLLKIV